MKLAFSESAFFWSKDSRKMNGGLLRIYNDGFISPRYYFSSWVIASSHLNPDCFLKMKKITEAV